MKNYTTITDQAKRVWTDENGWLRIEGVELTRETINKYLGSELDPDGKQGLEPGKVYNVYRSPESLETAIDDFTTIDVSNEHEMDEPEKRIESKGSVSSAEIQNEQGHKVVRGDVVIKDKPNIEAITKKVLNAFSVGYKSVLEFVKGETPWGEPYDVKIVKIIPNHLKLTNNPRVKTATITDEDFTKFDISEKKDKNNNIENKKDFDMKFSHLKDLLKKKTSLKDEEIQEIEKEMKDADYMSRIRAALQEAGIDEATVEKIVTALNPIIEDIKSEDAQVEEASAKEEKEEVSDTDEPEMKKEEEKVEEKKEEVETEDEPENKESIIETARKEARAAAEQYFKELSAAKEEVKDCFGNVKVGDDAKPADWYRAGCKAFGVNVENLKDEDLKVAFTTAKSMRATPKTKVSVKDEDNSDEGLKTLSDSLDKIKTK